MHGGNTEAWNYRPKAGGELVVYGGAGTGKTVGNLLRLLDYGDTYPGARMLIIRKTRVSLTESALATWENLILGQGHPVLGNPIQRTSRHQYLWRNTSVLVTGAMDKPDKVLSTE